MGGKRTHWRLTYGEPRSYWEVVRDTVGIVALSFVFYPDDPLSLSIIICLFWVPTKMLMVWRSRWSSPDDLQIEVRENGKLGD